MLSLREDLDHPHQLQAHHVVEENIHAGIRVSNSTAAMTSFSFISYQFATLLAFRPWRGKRGQYVGRDASTGSTIGWPKQTRRIEDDQSAVPLHREIRAGS